MTKEKIKRLKEASYSNDVISPLSPLIRHETWKLARTKPGGEMTLFNPKRLPKGL